MPNTKTSYNLKLIAIIFVNILTSACAQSYPVAEKLPQAPTTFAAYSDVVDARARANVLW